MDLGVLDERLAALHPHVFYDYFGIDRATIEAFGAFEPSLVADVPLFIEPFLIFNSKKEECQDLHVAIIKKVLFFTAVEATKVRRILKKLGMESISDVILIDARKGNKKSGSKA